MAVRPVTGKAPVAGGFEPGLSCFAGGLPLTVSFVVGRDISDTGMQADRIPELAGAGEFGALGGGSSMASRCGNSALRWPLKLSIQA